MNIVTFYPPVISYNLLKPGDIYEWDGMIWIVSPVMQDPQKGDFYIQDGVITGQYDDGGKPEGCMVMPMGRLRFNTE